MRLSVVIPTYNRARLLPQTISALAAQQLQDGDSYEVIFVSNGSTDGTDALLKETCSRYPDIFRYRHINPTGGPSAPRNTGIRMADGEVVIILDDDVLPEPQLVRSHADFHKLHPGKCHAAIGEAYVPESLLSDPMSAFHIFPYDQLRKLDRLSYLHFWTCNVSLKRDFMLESGMFDETFLYYEDMLCGHRLESHGMHLHFWPSARGQHLHQMSPAGLAAKGLFLGRWAHPFVERIPDPAAKKHLAILSTDLPLPVLLRRIAGRVAFRLVDNPLTMVLCEACGARRSQRNRLTDFYYGLIFRRNLLAGYYEAKRRAREGRPLMLGEIHSAVADRGDV